MLRKQKPFNILVVGTGMYACGRGTEGHGTIMPAICEWKKKNSAGDVFIAGTNPDGIRIIKSKISELERNMNVKLSVRYFPENDRTDPQCYKEAIRAVPRPACAIIAVPDSLHKEIAASAVEKGLHTLVVKPLVSTLKEAEELIRLQERKNVYCAVEFHKRFDQANLKLRDTILNGLIGEPLCFLVEYSQRKSVPSRRFIKWVKSTNVFQYLGVHYVDIIYFATKAIPKRLMAMGQKGWLVSKGIDTYDSIQGVIEWEMPSGGKFCSYILTNWVDPENTSAASDQKIKVIGTKGRFESDQKKRGITIVTDGKGIEEPNPYFCSAFANGESQRSYATADKSAFANGESQRSYATADKSAYGAKDAVSYRGYGIDSIHQFLDDAVRVAEGTLNIDDLENKRPTFKQSIVPTAVLEAVNKSLENNGNWIEVK